MKATRSQLMLASLVALAVVLPSSFAQRQLGKKNGPVSKVYVAETKGDTQIQNGDQIYTVRQATAFDAPGTVIETKANSHNALVYSNGTGLFVDENTRVEINRFTQEPFLPTPGAPVDSVNEPSVSQSNVHVSRGAVGICTNRLISGSSMLYSTPHGAINIRGGRLSIESRPDETIVDLLEGDITVRHGDRDVGGQIIRPGERAIIRPPASAGAEPSVTIGPIPRESLPADDERVEMACNARRSVTFEVLGQKAAEAGPAGDEAAGADAGQQIVARPTVPAEPPNNIVVSPDRLPGT